MSEAASNSNAAPASSSTPASAASAGSETQANSQADTEQSSEVESSVEFSGDVEAQSKPKEAPKPPEETPKLNVNEMIAKQIAGKLSDADIAALEKAGLSKEQLGVLAEAQRTVQVKNNQTLYELVGGEESYKGLKEFAMDNLSDSEIDGFNQALRSGNMKIAEMAVLGLKAMSERNRSKEPAKRLSTDGVSNNSESAYESQEALIKDLNNKKYDRDPAFTEMVNKRRAKSGF